MEHKRIQQIFERTNVQQIREFLMAGLELCEPFNTKPYNERINDGVSNIERWLKVNAKNDDELDKVFFDFGEAVETYREVFLEIGMKVGARLMFQLLCEND